MNTERLSYEWSCEVYSRESSDEKDKLEKTIEILIFSVNPGNEIDKSYVFMENRINEVE